MAASLTAYMVLVVGVMTAKVITVAIMTATVAIVATVLWLLVQTTVAVTMTVVANDNL
jgi:hypothetical protein